MEILANYRMPVGLGPHEEWTRLTIRDWGIWWRIVGRLIAEDGGATRPAFRDSMGGYLLAENS